MSLKRYYLNLLQRYSHCHFLLRREFSKVSSIDEQHIRQKEDSMNKNIQKGNKSVSVCIIGGGVTPLYTAVLLKQYQIIKAINLVDSRDFTAGALTDTCQMETSPRINYFQRKDLKHALKEVKMRQ